MSEVGADHSERSDRELVALHVDGDPTAFGELFRRHRDRLWAVALRTLGNPDDAADALQDAMVSAFRRASSYRGEAAVTTWLHRVVVNACLDRVRREAVRATDPLLPEDDRTERIATKRDDLEDRQLSLDLTAALATLPFEQRAALVLVDMEGYSVEEAARVLEVAPGTIKSRCARGRARLLPLVQHLRGDGSGTGSRAEARARAKAERAERAEVAGQAGQTGQAGQAGRTELEGESGAAGNLAGVGDVAPRTGSAPGTTERTDRGDARA